ncbi:MAG: hypothetical protein H7124_01350 [Phycisphaerales bacterium]|nr:hypothetical protein [Hyphomonadaceae bacterium]
MTNKPEEAGALEKASQFVTKQAAGWLVGLMLTIVVGTALWTSRATLAPTVCGNDMMAVACETLNLVDDRGEVARREILSGIEGDWGNAASAETPACATVLEYDLSRDGDTDVIEINGENWVSRGSVVAVDGDVIMTRTITPVDEAGTQWQLRLEPGRLTQVDHLGVQTTLVRCED